MKKYSIEEIEKWRQQNNYSATHTEIITQLLTENERYRAALKFYGNPKSWVPNDSIDDTYPAIDDAGERAQKALKGEE